jgi:hypothetical protein
MTVQVLNGNSFVLVGRWNGRNYAFQPGEALEIPEDAVRHIFGFGQDNRTGAYNRLGILKPGMTLAQAQEVVDQVKFITGKMVFEEPAPVPEPEKPRPGPDRNEEEDEEESESGKASAQQLAPGGSTDAERSASAIPVKKRKLTTLERIEANERKREHK